ncbi:class I SAM-dependent methyltransferase [Alkalicoccobacillus porphyridii]|uniref:Class I SAM-dependent methyltransferase n=1 Tax=Alkalicoccobacillus porphyridii TaxID=2597270 RepID=A0A554A1W1_9BACI|nr:class I SAM-dependent methyltransferase [Alkalicoccobacillus porphyridii]TSB47672.1 class I SAM-dependent methyltransferase [Alkalicoccobacillus porphyridii]
MTQTTDSWNAQAYDGKHSFVSNYGHALLDMLNPLEGETILDLGCGTGDLATKIAQSGAKVTGVDQSPAMVQQAQSKYPDLSFHVLNATKLPYQDEYDAIFSNAVLHWVKPPEQALSTIFQSLKSQGRFVAEFGGQGNVKQITDELFKQLKQSNVPSAHLEFPWYFPSIAEYTSLMEMAGFRVILAQHFDRPTPLEGEDGLRNWILMFGSSLFEGMSESSRDTIILNIEKALKDSMYQVGKWIADYKRIRVVGVKP